MLRAFHSLSISQASFALIDDRSAALCNSELGLVAALAHRCRSRVCCAAGGVVVMEALLLAVFDARWSSASLDLLTLRRGAIGVWVDRTD